MRARRALANDLRWISEIRDAERHGALSATQRANLALQEADGVVDATQAEFDEAVREWETLTEEGRFIDPALTALWGNELNSREAKEALAIENQWRAENSEQEARVAWEKAANRHEIAQDHHRVARREIVLRLDEMRTAEIEDAYARKWYRP